MPLAMVQPTPHPKSGVYRLRLTIPLRHRETAHRLFGVQSELTATLATKDKRRAIAAAPAILAKLQAKLSTIAQAHESGPRALSNQEVYALAGAWYREQVALNEADPGDPRAWDAWRDSLFDTIQHESGEPSPAYEPSTADIEGATIFAAEHGTLADAQSVHALAIALWAAKVRHADLMIRRGQGDYGADHAAAMIPPMPVQPERQPETPPASVVTFDSLLRGWAQDRGIDPDALPIPRAFYDRQRTIARLTEFIGHENASRLTKDDAVGWKESILGAGLSPATARNDISEMSAIWSWGIHNGKVAANPFDRVAPKKNKAQVRKRRRRKFDDAEASAILRAARDRGNGALRWLPWVLALTGARLSEICQSGKADVVADGNGWFIRLHDDAFGDLDEGEAPRSIKNEASIRTVPVHPALIAEGFLDYIDHLPGGAALFPDIKPDKLFGNRGNTAQRALGRWVRDDLGLKDPTIAPAHSWRHWFIDAARHAGMAEELRHAITGHADDGNESRRYGAGFRAMPDKLTEAIAMIKLPAGLTP